ncbi:MAG: hypothetical protein HYY13_09930 [Nitrospirae bacterium]|nr:hypothetical protein [Nitrospirota bacterium]
MRVLFCVPAPAGHFFPVVPVALEMRRRGHDVAFLSEADVGVLETVARLGMDGFLAGPRVRYRDWPSLHPGLRTKRGMFQTHYLMKRVVGPLVGEIAEQSLRIISEYRPDVVIVDTITFGSAMAAERLGIPWATSGLFLPLVEGKGSCPPGLGLGPPTTAWQFWLNRFIWWGGKIFARQYDPIFNEVRRRIGLPSIRDGFFSSTHSPYLYLAFSTREFEYPRADFPPQFHFVGVSQWDHRIDQVPPSWLETLDGRPVVYVTQGTAVGPLRTEFFNFAMEALAGEDVQLIVTTGNAVDLGRLGTPPPHVILERFVPHSFFLSRVGVMVHHGGFSTCMGGLCHGVPMVIVPFNWDQPDNARRVQELGAGVMLRPHLLTRGRLRRWVRRVLGEPSYRERARDVGARLDPSATPGRAADLIEALGKTGRPVLRG